MGSTKSKCFWILVSSVFIRTKSQLLISQCGLGWPHCIHVPHSTRWLRRVSIRCAGIGFFWLPAQWRVRTTLPVQRSYDGSLILMFARLDMEMSCSRSSPHHSTNMLAPMTPWELGYELRVDEDTGNLVMAELRAMCVDVDQHRWFPSHLRISLPRR